MACKFLKVLDLSKFPGPKHIQCYHVFSCSCSLNPLNVSDAGSIAHLAPQDPLTPPDQEAKYMGHMFYQAKYPNTVKMKNEIVNQIKIVGAWFPGFQFSAILTPPPPMYDRLKMIFSCLNIWLTLKA